MPDLNRRSLLGLFAGGAVASALPAMPIMKPVGEHVATPQVTAIRSDLDLKREYYVLDKTVWNIYWNGWFTVADRARNDTLWLTGQAVAVRLDVPYLDAMQKLASSYVANGLNGQQSSPYDTRYRTVRGFLSREVCWQNICVAGDTMFDKSLLSDELVKCAEQLLVALPRTVGA